MSFPYSRALTRPTFNAPLGNLPWPTSTMRQDALARRHPHGAGPSSTHLQRSGPSFVPGVKSPTGKSSATPRDPPTGRPNGPEDLGCQAGVISSLWRTPRQGRGEVGAQTPRSPAPSTAGSLGCSSPGSPSASRGHAAGRCPGARAAASPDVWAARRTHSEPDTCNLFFQKRI